MSTLAQEMFGIIKSSIDAHTRGIYAAVSLLEDCGISALIAPVRIQRSVNNLQLEEEQEQLVQWVLQNRITRICISYRLDPNDAVSIVGKIVYVLEKRDLYAHDGCQVRKIYFSGLPDACEQIKKKYNGVIVTFHGGEMAEETLRMFGIPSSEIPSSLVEDSRYDHELLAFGRKVVRTESYKDIRPLERIRYEEYGTEKDSLLLRLWHRRFPEFQPLIRAHCGPYFSGVSREECLLTYKTWCKELAAGGLLDVLSIGSSQLSQSNFGEDWWGKTNGGGVPVNSAQEYADIWDAARPMLVRTYSGTKNIEDLAELYEKTLHIAWHAFSLWWFNELDGRGPYRLYDNLRHHIQAMQIAAQRGTPVETNVSHHFAFRGCDDATYVVSGYIAAKMAKRCGVKTFVLQNMLNTPRNTWGVQDLAKSRTLIGLVKELEDDSFRVIIQTRAGIDFFRPNVEEAKAQLAAVTAMMDDIDPHNNLSPEIIHVVSFSEALFLATPNVINESIQITRDALARYRGLKQRGETSNTMSPEILQRQEILDKECREIIKAMETFIPNLYSAEGLYLAFVAGWLPVPELWNASVAYTHAKDWKTKWINGGICLVDHGVLLPTETRVRKCIENMADAKYTLKDALNAF